LRGGGEISRRLESFHLRHPAACETISRVKIKIFLFLAALGLLFTSGCIFSVNH